MTVVVRSLDVSDLAACGWAGSPTHLAYVRQALERLRRVRLGVGDDNPRARRLYERLGYQPTSEVEHGRYQAEDRDGRVTTIHSSSRVLTKALAD